MSANLRRSLHSDLQQDSFRANLERYLASFSELVAEEWTSFKELQTLTTGHNLDIMYANISEDAANIAALDQETSSHNSPEFKERLCHLMTLVKRSGYYCMPEQKQEGATSTTYLVFQLLGFKPWNFKYIERLTQWATDIWRGHLSVALLGKFTVEHEKGENDLPQDVQFTSRATSVQPFSLEGFFAEDRIDNLYEFTQVVHTTEFDKSSILDMAEDPSEELDATLVKLGVNSEQPLSYVFMFFLCSCSSVKAIKFKE